MTKQNIKGMTTPELVEFVESLGEKKFRASQLFQWMYGKKAISFDEMSSLSKGFRSILHDRAILKNLEVAARQTSRLDGTTKFLFRLPDGLAVETVLIPAEKDSPQGENRLTLCVSTQVGCPLNCAFCATGTMGFVRNLTAGEIVDQIIQVQRISKKRISNIVYMGMGEPMLNYDNVMKSIDIITDDRSLNIGNRHITVSTAGYADKIRRIADEGRNVKLALSLHSLDDEKRSLIMPINKKFPVHELVGAISYYYKKTRRRPTIEYILFQDFNDNDVDANKLVDLSKQVPCKINLIPFHSIEFATPVSSSATLKASPRSRIEAFAQRLRQHDLTVMVRQSAGVDIAAACGQLVVRQNIHSPDREQMSVEDSDIRGEPIPTRHLI